jgi:hypothetical protein
MEREGLGKTSMCAQLGAEFQALTQLQMAVNRDEELR